jgi:hypothetical protein
MLDGFSFVLYCISLDTFVSHLCTCTVPGINIGLIIGDKLINNKLM